MRDSLWAFARCKQTGARMCVWILAEFEVPRATATPNQMRTTSWSMENTWIVFIATAEIGEWMGAVMGTIVLMPSHPHLWTGTTLMVLLHSRWLVEARSLQETSLW